LPTSKEGREGKGKRGRDGKREGRAGEGWKGKDDLHPILFLGRVMGGMKGEGSLSFHIFHLSFGHPHPIKNARMAKMEGRAHHRKS